MLLFPESPEKLQVDRQEQQPLWDAGDGAAHLPKDTLPNTGLTPPGRGKGPPDPLQGWFLKRLNGKMGP